MTFYRVSLIKKLSSLIFIVFFFKPCFTQSDITKEIDSLNYIITKQTDKLLKANAYVELSEILHSSNRDTVLFLCNKSLQILNKINFKSLDSKNKIIFYKTKSLAFNNIGAFYYYYGNYAKSVNNFIESVKIRELEKDYNGMMESYNNIALIYKHQLDTLNSNFYFKKCFAIANKKNNIKFKSMALNGLGMLCSIDENKKALSYYFKSLEIEKKLNNKKEIGIREQNIAVVYQNDNNFKLAQEWYLKSIKTKTSLKDEDGLSSTLVSLAKLNFDFKLMEEAEIYAKKAYVISKKRNLIDNIIYSSELLYKIYSKDKKYEDALNMFIEQTQNKENKLSEANEAETIKLQMNYDFDKKLLADSLKTSIEKETLNLRIKDEKEKQLALYFFIFLTLCFSGLMFNRFKKTKKQKTIIEKQKAEVVLQHKEITDSINYAKRIQYTLLANEALINEHLEEHFVLFKPKDIVSGDFYWALQKNDNFYLAVCDSTGHGVPGAFMSLLNISFLNEAINEKNLSLPNEILDYVRKRLINNISQEGGQDGMDGVLLCFNKKENKINYAAAYNAPLIINNKKILNLNADRMPIGKSPKEHIPFSLYELNLEKGSHMYLYTDGYTDQFGGDKGKKFKIKQLQEKLLEICEKPMNDQENLIGNIFENWKAGYEQVDDMIVIGIKI